jgi:hypothetical protein
VHQMLDFSDESYPHHSDMWIIPHHEENEPKHPFMKEVESSKSPRLQLAIVAVVLLNRSTHWLLGSLLTIYYPNYSFTSDYGRA